MKVSIRGLGVRLFAVGALFCFFAAPSDAQVSPNIQTQANILSPPVTALPLGTDVTAPAGASNLPKARQALEEKSVIQKGACQPTDDQIKKAATTAALGMAPRLSQSKVDLTDEAIAEKVKASQLFTDAWCSPSGQAGRTVTVNRPA